MKRASNNSLIALTIATILIAVITLTFRPLANRVRLGLEFKGGYEMLYVATPKPGSEATQATMIDTVHRLEQRSRSSGVAEPDIRLENRNQIRVRLPGVATDAAAKSIMRDSGDLPVILVEKYSQTVGSQLGDNSLLETVRAGIAAVIVVATLLIAIYRLPGIIAIIGVGVYLWTVIAAFALMRLTLSLSGFVALVLGVGLAAGANVIIYERFREAFGRGEDRRDAVREATLLGGRAIAEASLAALVAAGLLLFSGIAPIQAFAQTMLVSIVASILTNYLLTSLLFFLISGESAIPDWLFPRKNPTTEAKPLNLFKYRTLFFGVALLSIVAGVGSLIIKRLNLDIDFKAGTMLDITLEKAVSQEAATDVIMHTGIAPDGVSIGGTDKNKVTARFQNILNSAQIEQVVNAFKPGYGQVQYEENTADPSIARDFVLRSVVCILLTALIVACLVAVRFGWQSAVGATVAMLFSSFFVLGFFSLFGHEIDLTFIAAILTVLTYTINECVIVFDRIRENRTISAEQRDTKSLANLSVTQTIRRAFLTVLMLMIAAVSLYFLGAEPLQMFSLAIFVGLVAATFGSIALAASIWTLVGRGPEAVVRVSPGLPVGFRSHEGASGTSVD
jgi:preprotein translocase SecF subunit